MGYREIVPFFVNSSNSLKIKSYKVFKLLESELRCWI